MLSAVILETYIREQFNDAVLRTLDSTMRLPRYVIFVSKYIKFYLQKRNFSVLVPESKWSVIWNTKW